MNEIQAYRFSKAGISITVLPPLHGSVLVVIITSEADEAVMMKWDFQGKFNAEVAASIAKEAAVKLVEISGRGPQ